MNPTTSIEEYSFAPLKVNGNLDLYIEKKPKFCSSCGHWTGKRCKIGYITNATMPACHQAIAVQAMLKAGML